MATITTNSDRSKTVELSAPIDTHDGPLSRIRLREPGWRDFRRLGDPSALVISGASILPQVDQTVVASYIVELSGLDELALDRIKNLDDALALSQAVTDFFKEASARLLAASSTPSSSATAS